MRLVPLVSIALLGGCAVWTDGEINLDLEVLAEPGDVDGGDAGPPSGDEDPVVPDPTDCDEPLRPVGVAPGASAIDVEITDPIEVTFSEAIEPGSVTVDSFFLDNGATGLLVVSGRSILLQPGAPLVAGATYTATVTETVTGVSGCPLVGSLHWSFTTEPEPIEPALMINLLFRQDVIGDAGIWFSSQDDPGQLPKLAVTFTENGARQTRTYQGGLERAFAFYLRAAGFEDAGCRARATDGAGRECHMGELRVDERDGRRALLRVDASDIPPSAVIDQCSLVLHLHEQEGLAWNDHTSVIGVYETTEWDWDTVTWSVPWQAAGGDIGARVTSIRAHEDMHERGWTKASPTGSIDLTAHLRALHAAR